MMQIKHIDYSNEEYVNRNELTTESTPNRVVTHHPAKGGIVYHMINIEEHPAHLLPGGKGASKADATGPVKEKKPRKAAKKAKKGK